MQRVFELIEKVSQREKYDGFFDSIQEFLKEDPQCQYEAYEKAFVSLDKISWNILSEKAISHYFDHRPGQLKQGFFNQLNEAFAYQFLVWQKYQNVQIIYEDKSTKTPDIAYEINGHKFYCEVKTISISEKEIQKWQESTKYSNDEIEYYQDDKGVKVKGVNDGIEYEELSKGFLIQLWNIVCEAFHMQIKSQNENKGEGIVFIIVNFDDRALTHYERYKEQIMEVLYRHPVPEIYIKVHLTANKWIHKQENLITSS